MQVKYFKRVFDNISSTQSVDNIVNLYSDILSIQVDGTFSAMTLKVYGKTTKEGDTFVELASVNMTTFDIVTSITSKGIFETAVEGICMLKLEISSISGGNATVDIRLVSTGV